jgi:hypothetical protein
MKITKASYDAWLEEQEKALRTIEKIALFEGKTKDPTELQTAVIVNGCAIMAHDHKALKILEGAAGDIPNI